MNIGSYLSSGGSIMGRITPILVYMFSINVRIVLMIYLFLDGYIDSFT